MHVGELRACLQQSGFSTSGRDSVLRVRYRRACAHEPIPEPGEMGRVCKPVLARDPVDSTEPLTCGLIWGNGSNHFDDPTPGCDGWLCTRLRAGFRPPFEMAVGVQCTKAIPKVPAHAQYFRTNPAASPAAAAALTADEEGGGSEEGEGEGEGEGAAQRLKESPGRKRARDAAAEQLSKQAKAMQRNASNGLASLPAGTVVRVAVADVDRARTDSPTATFVIVEAIEKGKTHKETMYKLACEAGVLKTLYSRSYVDPVPQATPALVGLQSVLESYQGLPQDISMRACIKSISAAGGQGMVRCDCKGACDNNRCKCNKAGRKCNSRCHKGNTHCTNCDI